MSSLTISERQVDGVVVVDLAGKITLGDSNRQLHETIRRLAAAGKRNVLLNLAKVTAIDSSGLGEIVAGFSTIRSSGGSLKLVNLTDRVEDVMTITKLYTVLDVFGSESEGVASFRPNAETVTQPLAADFEAEARSGGSLS